MSRLTVACALLTVLASPALAQPFAGGQGGMPDPRQMSGIPRGVPDDPAGQLVVRVVQGSIVQNAPEGTVVHLVGVHSDGSVSRQLGRVATDKRCASENDPSKTPRPCAAFSGLATDGRTAYYAMAVLPRGEKEDRVMSRTIMPPPRVGARVVLAGLAPDSADPGVDDSLEANMTAPAPGTVRVEIAGNTTGVSEVRLFEVGDPTAALKAPLVNDGRGRLTATFTDVPIGSDKVYLAEAISEGRLYRATPVQLTAAKGAVGSIIVSPSFLFTLRTAAELDDTNLWFTGTSLGLWNVAGSPFDPGEDGIAIPLPVGAKAGSVGEEFSNQVTFDKERGFVWTRPFPPGSRQFQAQFALSVVDGAVDIDWPLPYGVIQGQVIFQMFDGMSVDVLEPANVARRMRDLEGRNFLILENINLRESGRLRLRVTGLPERAGWQRTAPWVALGFVALFLGIAGFGALSRATSESVDDARTDDLTLRRDTLYEKLVKLEKNHRQGNVPDNRYQRTRKQLVSQLEAIYRELRDRRSGDEGVETDDPGPS